MLTIASYAVSLEAPRPADQSPWCTPFALTGAVLVFLTFNKRLPRNRAIEWLSHGSYFLYLFHRPIYAIVARHVADGVPRLLALSLICFPLAIVGSYLGQRAYDRLVERISRRSARPSPADA